MKIFNLCLISSSTWASFHVWELIFNLCLIPCMRTNLQVVPWFMTWELISGFFFKSCDLKCDLGLYKALVKRTSQVDASQRKFAKAELAYGLAKGGQTDSQVGSQVAKSRKFHAYHWLMLFYDNRLIAINLCRLALGGQTVKYLHLVASKFELDPSQCKSTQVDASRCKSTQVGGQAKRKLNASTKLVSTCESVWPGLKSWY